MRWGPSKQQNPRKTKQKQIILMESLTVFLFFCQRPSYIFVSLRWAKARGSVGNEQGLFFKAFYGPAWQSSVGSSRVPHVSWMDRVCLFWCWKSLWIDNIKECYYTQWRLIHLLCSILYGYYWKPRKMKEETSNPMKETWRIHRLGSSREYVYMYRILLNVTLAFVIRKKNISIKFRYFK